MSTPARDPFSTPTPRASAFASADSFRGRLVLIRPTKLEHDVPKQANKPDGAKGDRVTANVTVVDGLGPVQVFAQRQPTGKFLDGPDHRGVWFNQDQLAAGLQDVKGGLLPLVLARIETLKPGTMQGQGNPWTFIEPTEEDKQIARNFLANQMVGGASAPTQPAPQQAAPPVAPAPAQQSPFSGPPASTGVPTGPPF